MRTLDDESRQDLSTKWQLNKVSQMEYTLILTNETLQFGEETYPIRFSSFICNV